MKLQLFRTAREYRLSFDVWQRWFAWHPVLIDGAVVWLESIERKRYASWYEVFWEYRRVTG